MKTQAPGIYVLPDLTSDGYDVDSSASADTYGSWQQAIASTSEAFYIVGIMVDTQGLALYTQLQIGVGASASEAVQATMPLIVVAERRHWSLPFPIPIASGARVALKAADEDAAARDYDVWLMVSAQSDLVSI